MFESADNTFDDVSVRQLADEPRIFSLPTFDLSAVMARVLRENPDWSVERLNAAEQTYRKFCSMAVGRPNERDHILDNDMDAVWHAHILYTRKYAEDCMNYLGFFMHHEPVSEGVPFDGTDPCSRDYQSFRWC